MGYMDQTTTIRFLESGVLGPGPVARRTTSLSELFLAGDAVYKLKRAVTLPYVDFSHLAARKWSCEREVALNRRTAPGLYLGVVAVTRDGTGLALDGPGEPVDYLVHMRRFDEATLFDTMADRGRLTDRHVIQLADQLAAFHDRLEPLRDRGGHKAMARAIANVVKAATGRQVAQTARIEALATGWRALLGDAGPRLDSRRRHGWVRECHGDLHLANICLVDGQPTPFDCIEFNDDLACIDTAYDLAFPVMDLMAHQRHGLANLLLNRYLCVTQDYTALPVMRLFIAARALVRACVTAMEDRHADVCRAYLDVAEANMAGPAPRLIAIGGRSGTGKSTLAGQLAGPCDAIWLRTDMIRKAMLGARPEEKLPETAYSREVTERTYRRLTRTALRALADGWPVILDAVFLKPEERAEAARIARLAGVPFDGLWLEAPVELRAERVSNRRGDASDADATIARLQEDMEAGAITWRRIDVSGELQETVKRARAALATGNGSS